MKRLVQALGCAVLLAIVSLAVAQTTFQTSFRYDEIGNLKEIVDATGRIPQAPSSLIVTAITSRRITLSWTDNSSGLSEETQFLIERKSGSSAFMGAGAVTADVTTSSDSGLTPETTYVYRVRAKNDFGSSQYSNEATAMTLPPGIPEAPSSLAAKPVNAGQINIVWTDNSLDEFAFTVERKTGASGTYTMVAVLGPDATGHADTSVEPSTAYLYRVKANGFKGIGDSAYSNEAQATSLAANSPITPSALAIRPLGPGLRVTWTDNVTYENGYVIERKMEAIGEWAEVGSSVVSTGPYYYDDLVPPLLSNATYYYRVRAYMDGTPRAYVTPYSNEARGKQYMTWPSAVAVTPLGVSLRVSWADNSSFESGFKVERKSGPAGTWAEIATTNANATLYDDATVQPGNAYFYRLRAFDAGGGYTEYSDEASGQQAASATPSALTATRLSNTSVRLNWADNTSDESGFKIERRTGSAGTYSEIGATAANAASYDDSTVQAATTYFYRVRAYATAGGVTQYSNEAMSQACPSGQILCSNVCVNTATDTRNCGACGVVCGYGYKCSSGQCSPICPSGYIYCDPTCVKYPQVCP